MISKNILLQRAEDQFLNRDYSNALKIYGLLLKDYPQLKDARVGAYLSDMGFDLGDDAQALFDYYQAIKETSEDADEIIDTLSQTIYATRFVVQEQISGSIDDQIESQDGIRYQDFLDLIESTGNFRDAFENIMFSTKVVITNKDEFIDFIKRLVDADYDEIALKYLDSISSNFAPHQDVYELYSLIEKE